MPDPRRLRSVVGLIAASMLALAVVGATAPGEAAAAEKTLPAWTGGVNVYRTGVFTTQRSWLWCTAADVQIIGNIVDHRADHTTSGQRRYFAWMRDRNRYDLPVSAGVDPVGWTAGLRHFVDDRYRLVSSRSFDAALRSAVTRLRLTGLPVALAVEHGNHGWILTGFRATADPARTSSFTVTSVRVTGPLYGLQSKNGYDMAPNTKLTTAQLKRYFTPWKYAPKAMIWDGRYVSIQPVPTAGSTTAAVPASRAPAHATEAPHPSVITGAITSPGPSVVSSPVASVASPAAAIVIAEPSRPDTDADPTSVSAGAPVVGVFVAALLALAAGVAVVTVLGIRRRRQGMSPPA